LNRAKSKVADYRFTTLEPHLGEMYGYIIADIPGLIEGASENKGLGHKFLRHIKRTKVLLHCIPADTEDFKKDFEVIMDELKKYDNELAKKPQIAIITKADTATEERIHEMSEYLKNKADKIEIVSVLDDKMIKSLRDSLANFVKEK